MRARCLTYPATGLVVMEIHQALAVLPATALVAALAFSNVDERLGKPVDFEWGRERVYLGWMNVVNVGDRVTLWYFHVIMYLQGELSTFIS